MADRCNVCATEFINGQCSCDTHAEYDLAVEEKVQVQNRAKSRRHRANISFEKRGLVNPYKGTGMRYTAEEEAILNKPLPQ